MSGINPKMKEVTDFKDVQRALPALEDNVLEALARIAAQALPKLTPTNMKTAAYTAGLDELVPVSGTFTVTLPVAAVQNKGHVVGLVLTVASTITVASVGTLVQGAATDLITTAGLYLYVSTGVGWWRPPLSAGGGVTTFTAGAGLVNSGSAANPIADVVAGDTSLTVAANSVIVNVPALAGAGLVAGVTPAIDIVAGNGTIVVNADSIQVGTITSASVDDSIATTSDTDKLRIELQHVRLLLMEMVEMEAAHG